MSFTQGHALIIGVGRYQHISSADVPIAVEDAMAVEQVIKDEKLCGYPAAQVESLSDAAATHAGTLAALDRLAQRTGEGDSVFLFYAVMVHWGQTANIISSAMMPGPKRGGWCLAAV